MPNRREEQNEPTSDYQRHSTTCDSLAGEVDQRNEKPFADEDGRRNGATESDDGSVFLLDVYETKQRYGYLSIGFSVVQTLVLIAMMIECTVAPININPMIGPYPDALSYWGAKNSYLILEEGKSWRLITPLMLHAGVIHLMGNVSVQIESGAFFEREWGSLIWLIIYLTSAVGGSILSTIFIPGVISVGSSGAVMGIFGAKLSEIFCRVCERRETVQERVGHAIRMHQLWGTLGGVVVVMLMSFIPYVDWAAHLGGLLAGMFVGLAIFSCTSMWNVLFKLVWFSVGLALTVIGFSMALTYMYNEVEPDENLKDVCGYYAQFFEDYECRCMLDEHEGGSGDH